MNELLTKLDDWRPTRPNRAAGWLVVGLAWTWCVLMIAACSLLGPGLVALVPIIFLAGTSGVTAAHRWAFDSPERLPVAQTVGEAVSVLETAPDLGVQQTG